MSGASRSDFARTTASFETSPRGAGPRRRAPHAHRAPAGRHRNAGAGQRPYRQRAGLSNGSRTARGIEATHDGATAHIDLGQALRGHRFAHRARTAGDATVGDAEPPTCGPCFAHPGWCGRRAAMSPWTPPVRTSSSCWTARAAPSGQRLPAPRRPPRRSDKHGPQRTEPPGHSTSRITTSRTGRTVRRRHDDHAAMQSTVRRCSSTPNRTGKRHRSS